MKMQRKGGKRDPGARGREMHHLRALPRRKRALELRAQGYTYQEIADELGYSDRSGAYRTVQAGMKNYLDEPAKDALEMELMRLDHMLNATWDRAVGGDTKAVNTVLRIMERRSKLLGLDNPTGINENVKIEFINDWRKNNGKEN